MVTGGSRSAFTSFNLLAQAGAAGRLVLHEQGAKLLGVAEDSCHVSNSEVICSERSIHFGDIVKAGDIDRVFTAEELAAMPVKAAQERTLIGEPVQALDIPAKTDGSAQFGIDSEVDGMVYARPLIPPTRYGSMVNAVDDSAAKNVKGYPGYQVLTDPSQVLQGWVVAVADNQWSAIKSADAIKVDWTAGPVAGVSDQDVMAEGERLVNLPDSGTLFVSEGDIEQAMADASRTILATYRTGTALHFQLEPVNATVELKDGAWHVHTGNQWQSLIIPVLAKALEVEESQIVLHQYYLGGGFGRRLWGDYILPAALTAKNLSKPVKVVFTREDDARFDCVRSASVAKFVAALNEENQLTGIDDATGAMAQAEGSAFWGLSLALHEGTKIENGRVADTNLNGYSPLRMGDVPKLHIEFVDSKEFPVGLDEPGVTVVAPAVANAIFNAVGVRMRDLPIRAASVKAALST